ncbi:MAG: AAA family ATPase [Planctomycetota bacterium]
MNDVERLTRLLKGRYACISIVTHEEALARQLVYDAAVTLNLDLKVWSVTEGLRDATLSDGSSGIETDHPAAALAFLAQQQGRFVTIMLDLVSHLKDARTLRTLRELLQKFEKTGSTLVLIDHEDQLPSPVRTYTAPFTISLPDENELERIVRRTLRDFNQEHQLEVAISKKAFKTIIRNLRGLSRRQAEQIIIDAVSDDYRFDSDDINSILARKRQMMQGDGLLEYIETPARIDEIGGLAHLKSWLRQRQDAVGQEAAQFGLNAPKGVLMLGVQGAGKSLCAKAIATAWQRPLLRMDVGALYDKYIGESERRLAASLRQAEMMAPIILWIDEIEKAFASAAAQSSDGGLSKRMFGALLTWMQEHTAPVFLVATANDIEALPPELLRKGRFDEVFFVDLPRRDTRREIFAIHLKKRKRDPEKFDIDALAKASDGFSGAEIEQAVIAALHEAFARKCDLDTQMILRVIQTSPPLSITMAEKVAELRAWARNRCVPAE